MVCLRSAEVRAILAFKLLRKIKVLIVHGVYAGQLRGCGMEIGTLCNIERLNVSKRGEGTAMIATVV